MVQGGIKINENLTNQDPIEKGGGPGEIGKWEDGWGRDRQRY